MKPTEQQNNDARAENTDDRNLTPRQIQKRKKMMIFPLFFLAFSGCMWLIFAPSRQPEQSVAGFNTELPTPETDGIVSDKREAYMQEDFERTQRTKMQSLQDFAWEPTEEDLSGPVSHPGTGSSHDVFRSAADAHADIDRQIGSFYEATAGEEDEKERMQARIEELERRLEENETSRTTQDEQIALLEKSYEIAARYLNGEQTSAPAAASQPTAGTDQDNRATGQTASPKCRIAAGCSYARFGVPGRVCPTPEPGHSTRSGPANRYSGAIPSGHASIAR